MNKIIIVLCAIFALARAYIGEEFNLQAANEKNIDSFVKMHFNQFQNILNKQKAELEKFTDLHKTGAEKIDIQRNILVNVVNKENDRLNPMELLNDLSKNCIAKYRYTNTTEYVDDRVKVCIENVKREGSSLLNAANALHSSLEDFLHQQLEAIKKCGTPECIFEVIKDTDEHVARDQKEFQYMLDDANCRSKEIDTKSKDCFFGVHNDVFSGITISGININNCVANLKKECEPCAPRTCDIEMEMEIDRQNETIYNPLVSHQFSNRGCVIYRNTEHQF